jgi:hypothetical protein
VGIPSIQLVIHISTSSIHNTVGNNRESFNRYRVFQCIVDLRSGWCAIVG